MTEEFGNVEVFTGQEKEPEGPRQMTAAPSTMATVEQARAIAETQSALVIARANPRDEHVSYLKIIKACKRRSFAEQAKWAYKRGGKLLSGDSVKLMQVMAQCWGNIDFGFRELSREGDKSEVEAYAWDLETNTRVKRTFQVRHYRDKGGGTVKVEGERDKYELIAGLAQRRVRSCLENIIPPDIIQGASQQCDETIKKGDGRPVEDQVRDMLVAFDALGVTKDMIEAWLQHKTSAIVPAQIVQLKQIYRSIKDGVAPREDFFSLKVAPAGKVEDPEKPEGGESNSDPWDEKAWVNLRKAGFATFVHKNLATFKDVPVTVQAKVIRKWSQPNFYPETPFPTVETLKGAPGNVVDAEFEPPEPLPPAVPTPPDPWAGLRNARENPKLGGEDAFAVACEAVFGEPERTPQTPEEAKSVTIYMNQIAESGTEGGGAE